MSEFYNSILIKKARHDHKCALCDKPILKGTSYLKTAGLWEGSFFENKYHESCEIWLKKYLNAYGYGEYSVDEFQDWMQEEHCQGCPLIDDCLSTPLVCDLVKEKLNENQRLSAL